MIDEVEPEGGTVIPFPRLRPSAKLSERWYAEVRRLNEAKQKRYILPSPLDAVPALVKKRSMPAMAWPAEWPEFARRCRTYVGEAISITAAIGAGKTSFALQLCNASAAAGHPVIWVPLELDPEQLDLRICANMHGASMTAVREEWPEDAIRHTLTAVDDMWHFVDQYDDPEASYEATSDAIEIAWRVYGVPPIVAVDHLGELVAEDRDASAATRRWATKFRRLFLRSNSFGVLLNQVSKGNQGATTGKVDFDSATDAMGIEMASQAVASVCTNSIVLVVFKQDDSPELDGHALLPKCRNTGLEGRVGLRFRKAGGQWSELDYLPATPLQVKAVQEKESRDKHRASPPSSTAQARADLNAARAGDAAAMRRHYVLEAIRRHGALGMTSSQLRKIPGTGRGPLLNQAVQELAHAGAIERIGNDTWRILT